MTDLNPKALEAAEKMARRYTHEDSDEEEAAKDIVTAYLETADHGWQPIATFSDDVSGQIVAMNFRGQTIVWDADRLRKNIAAQREHARATQRENAFRKPDWAKLPDHL